jgi:DNA polymerase III subunit epsilon
MFAIIDIETTGGNPRRDKITEIAVFVHDGLQVVDSYQTLINPERNIPPFITKMTGITDEMVKYAPKFYEVAKDIVEITEGRVFVAHNVTFDYGFIAQEYLRLGYNYQREKLCTVQLSRKSFPGLESYSLGKLCDSLNIVLNDRHRAAGDCLATVKLFEMILNNSPQITLKSC